MEEKLGKYLDPECFPTFVEGPEGSARLLKERYDLIFFTGGTHIGKNIFYMLLTNSNCASAKIRCSYTIGMVCLLIKQIEFLFLGANKNLSAKARFEPIFPVRPRD